MAINLSEVMTTDEQAAILALVKAHLAVQAKKFALHEAEVECGNAARRVTDEYFRYENKCRVSTIPESLVITFNGKPWFIEIDTEGDHGHRVRMIGGIL